MGNINAQLFLKACVTCEPEADPEVVIRRILVCVSEVFFLVLREGEKNRK